MSPNNSKTTPRTIIPAEGRGVMGTKGMTYLLDSLIYLGEWQPQEAPGGRRSYSMPSRNAQLLFKDVGDSESML